MLQLPLGISQILTMIITNTLLGVLVAFIYGLLFPHFQIDDKQATRWHRRQNGILVGVIVGSTTFFVVLLFNNPLLALAWATAEALLFGLLARYAYGNNFNNEIKIVSALSWSWRGAGEGGAIGLVVAIVAEILETQLYGSNGYWQSILLIAFGGLLLGGLTGHTLKESVRPNQGIWLSLRNSVITACLAGTLIGLLTGLVLLDSWMGVLTAVFMALLVAPLYGASNVTKHFLIRGLLWLNGHIPENYSLFLNHAVDIAFLYRVGGGYIFIHRLLQEHFASKTNHPL